MVERQKTEAIIAKCHKNRGRICLFSREEQNHESDTRDKTDPDQPKDKYILQL